MKKNNYFLFGLLIFILVLSFLVVQNFISALLGAVVLSFMFSPINEYLFRKIKNKNISSLLTVLIIFLIFLVPLVFIANLLLQQALNIYSIVNQLDFAEFLNYFGLGSSGFGYSFYVLLQELPGYLVNLVSDFVFSLPQMMLQFFIMLFATFYFLKDNELIWTNLKTILPLKKKYRELFVKEFRDVTQGVVFGIVVTGLIQGLVGTIGLLIFGVPNALLWGVVLTFLAMLPFVGPFLVWAPASLYLYFIGDVFSAVLLFVYGLVVVSLIDNIVRPALISAKSRVHPLIILIGLFGGLGLFGFVGIVLGPLILAYLAVVFRIFKSEHIIKLK